MSDPTQPACVECKRTSNEVPLIPLEYGGQRYWICPQHLPLAIHKPHELVGKLPGAEELKGHQH